MRLIDADVLMKRLEKSHEYHAKTSREEVLLFRDIRIINEQPTAYDPDKVVEQLEKLKKAEQDRQDDCDEDGCGDGEQIYDDGRSQGRFEAYVRAIEIAKGGGADERN